LGVVLLLLAVWGGQWVYRNPAWAGMLSFGAEPLAWGMIVYGFAASVLPIWLLLAPRDYLSTFMKLGTIFLLALGILVLLPKIRMPALTPFAANGQGPVFAGKLFPFCFITIACGAVSGFHALIASGTTPKILTREGHARAIGYGAMCLESMVAIMALIAACSLEPGVYFSMNIKGAPEQTVAKVSAMGYEASLEKMNGLATTIGEKTLFGRVGGAPTLAVGMASVFAGVSGGVGLDLWYHFAIMFEALFILTTLDAGTRVGRYLLQDFLGQIWKPLGETKKLGPAWLASFLIVSAWGWFLVQGVRDPLGGINSLWPLFGIANQLLAAIALCLATTVILKMQLQDSSTGRPAYAWITLAPLLWLLTVTGAAGVEKIWHPDPKIGFLAAAAANAANPRLRFNFLLDAAVTSVFLVMISAIVALSVREWILLLARQRNLRMTETAPVWLPAYAVPEARPRGLGSLLLLGLLLAREWSGQAAIDREQATGVTCGCAKGKEARTQAYLQVARKRFDGINRCC
jgi:carbon starvation protein